MDKKQLKLAQKNGVIDKVYEAEVNRLIRVKYTLSNELAIIRQRDSKPAEFATYCAYAEECKAKAKATIASLLGN